MITVHADSPEDVVYRLAIPLANTGQQEVSRKLVEAVLPKPTMRADRVSVAPSGEGALAEAEILVVDDDSAGWTGGYANSGKQDENTLNSIASLSRSEPDRMASLLNEFGQYLRESFGLRTRSRSFRSNGNWRWFVLTCTSRRSDLKIGSPIRLKSPRRLIF